MYDPTNLNAAPGELKGDQPWPSARGAADEAEELAEREWREADRAAIRILADRERIAFDHAISLWSEGCQDSSKKYAGVSSTCLRAMIYLSDRAAYERIHGSREEKQ
jgi:hypothetical protein